jgi:serine/threonine-protein kinase
MDPTGSEAELGPVLQSDLLIPGYVIEELIGEGGMGRVYRGRHSDLDRTVAVKVLPALGGADAISRSRFRQEAKAIAQLRHPNIVSVFDFGESGRTPYMVVEYLPRGSLADRLEQDGPPLIPASLELLRGVASALDHAHEAGIVHRDVKPANVLLGEGDQPILADFGLAKMAEGSLVNSMSGTLAGTPAYAAPEQVLGGSVGPAADRYAFATVAYELLTGQVPFTDSTAYAILYSQVNRPPAAPSRLRPELGARVDEVILRGLAKEPRDRWPSCMAMVTALEQALAGGKGTPKRLHSLRAPLTTTMGPPRRSLAGRLVAFAGVLAVAAVLLGGTLSVMAARHSPDGPTAKVTDSLKLAGTPDPLLAASPGVPSAAASAPAPPAESLTPSGNSFRPPPKPSPTPGATPGATLRPSPSGPAPALSIIPASPKIGRMAAITGTHFLPGRTVTIGLVQGDQSQVLSDSVTVGGNGSLTLSSPIPVEFKPGPADLFACVKGTDTCLQKAVALSAP